MSIKYLAILDAGHAEKVAGKEAPDKSMREWEFNDYIQNKAKSRCEAHGISIYLTNPSPKGKDEMGLSKRSELANSYYSKQGKPKTIFVSIHANAASPSSARGVETFIAGNASTTSKNFANTLNTNTYNSLKALDSGFKNRGVKTENFTVIYKANMPSVLWEVGFYTNKEDLNLLKNKRADIVEVLVKSLCEYFGVKYVPPGNTTPPPVTPPPVITEDNRVFDIVTGGLGSKENAIAMGQYINNIQTQKWYHTVEQVIGFEDQYCLRIGGFTGEEKVKQKMNALAEVTGWWMVYELQK
ncbi:MAG: N-acetylmuramoyl-L-alanine amidase [Paraclostridium sp.]